MLNCIVGHKQNKFYITFNSDNDNYDSSEFSDTTDYLKKLYLYYDPTIGAWVIPDKRVDEILNIFSKDKVVYLFTDIAANKLETMQKVLYSPETKFFRGRHFDTSILNQKVTLFNYQKEAIHWRIKRSSYLDAYDAGLGKTCVNICVTSSLYKHGEIDAIFILAPSGLAYHWKREILSFTNLFKEDDFLIIDNVNKTQPFNTDKKIIIIPHHLLSDVLLSYKKGYKFGKSAKKIRWKQYINIKKEWGKESIALILDESHGFKNTDSIRFKALNSIKYIFDYRFLLSATPAINKIEDIYGQLSIVDKSIIPMSEKSFKLWIAKEIGNKWDPYAIKKYDVEKVEQLKAGYKPYINQKAKEDLSEMKARRIVKPIYLNMTSQQKTLYKLVTEEMLIRLEEEFGVLTWKTVLNKLPYLCSAIDNPLLLKDKTWANSKISKILDSWTIEKDPKYYLLKNILEDYVEYQGKKVIVWDYHPATLSLLHDKFKKYNPLVIHGQTNNTEEERQHLVDMFNTKDKNKVFFLSAITSSAGLNLQYKCNNAIFYTLPWDATLTRQAMDRTHRIVSKTDTLLEFFIMDNSIDNLRYKRNLSRIDYNESLNKEISKSELINLLGGIV